MESSSWPSQAKRSGARAHLRLAARVRAVAARQKLKARATAKAKTERATIAIFHATTKPLSRSAGRSSVAASAYRAGVALTDSRTGLTHDFTRRAGVVVASILTPAGAGAFAADRQTLWNAAEAAEKRKDARTAREWVLALPAELTADQRADLAFDFGRALVGRYGVAADVAVHTPARDGDGRNHHAHILCTTRKIVGAALIEKCDLELSDSKRKALGLAPAADEIKELREHWAGLVNAALEKAGNAERVDHRSLVEQQEAAFDRGDLAEALALDRAPQRHVGVNSTQLDRRAGKAVSERGKLRERIEAAAQRARSAAARWAREFMESMRPAAEKLVMAEAAEEQPAAPPENPLAAALQKWRRPASTPQKAYGSGYPAARPKNDDTHPPRPALDNDQERGFEP